MLLKPAVVKHVLLPVASKQSISPVSLKVPTEKSFSVDPRQERSPKVVWI